MDTDATIADSAAVAEAPKKRRAGTIGNKGGRRLTKREAVTKKKQIVAIAKSDPLATQKEIAEKVGVHPTTVADTLAKYGIKQGELREFEANKPDILLGMQSRILASISDEDIAKSSLKDRTIALGVMYDKHRLETGQSTANVASLTALVTGAALFDKPTPQDATPKGDAP